MARNIAISDITMKLSEYNGGANLSFRRKVELTKMLCSLGVPVIELGSIVRQKVDPILFKTIAGTVKSAILVVTVDPAAPDGVAHAWNSVKDAVHPRLQVSLPVSTVRMEYDCHLKADAMLGKITSLVSACSTLCDDVEFVAEDFSRADHDFLFAAIKAAVESGAKTVTVKDEACNLLFEPFNEALSAIRAILPAGVRLGVWCSNELFLADALALSAVKTGADEVKVASYGKSTTSMKRFVHILTSIPDAVGVTCGIDSMNLMRVAGQIKNLCAEDGRPGSLSNLEGTTTAVQEELSITPEDDINTVLATASKLGYDLNPAEGKTVYDMFLQLAMKNNAISIKEFEAILGNVAFQAPAVYSVENYVVNTGNTISSTCHLRIRKNGMLLESICLGDGPVDAAFLAMEKLLDRHYELDDFQIRSVTEGRQAMGEAVVSLRNGGKVYSGRGISTDIVGSSINAYVNALNKIVFEEDEA